MRILVIGGGGREHAIAKALTKNVAVEQIWMAPGNGGTENFCENVPIAATDLERGVNLTAYRHTPQYQQACAVMSLNEERWDIERRIRDFVWLQYGWFLKEHGITDYTTEEAARTYREGSKTNAWVSSRKDIYSRLMHPEIMQLLEQEQDLIVRTIYAINNPVTRHFRLEKVKD